MSLWCHASPDWGSYYRTCELCRERWHASEGGCGCADDWEDCACGARAWQRVGEEVACARCHTRPGEGEDEDEDEDENPVGPLDLGVRVR